MAPAEQFSLRWNNFYSNLTSGFHELMEEHDMVDVTIAAEGHFIQAHKIVLSICSPFFKQLFKINPCKHPIVILNDVTFENLKDILEFIYLGEVNVLRDNLASFLRTAQLLQVKGLTEDDTTNDTNTKNYNNREDEMIDQLENLTKSSPSNDEIHSHLKRSNLIEKVSIKKAKQESILSQQPLVTNYQNHLNANDLSNNEISCKEAPNIKHYSKMTSSGGDKDHFTFNKKSVNDILDFNTPNSLTLQDDNYDNGKNPVLSTSSKHPFQCLKCSKKFSRRDHLRTHEKNIHGEDAGPFTCVICSQLYKNSESLRKHIAKFHYPKIIDNQQKTP